VKIRKKIKRSCDAECQPLVDELLRHGAQEHIARRLAVRFWNLHQPQGLEVLQTFLATGWSVTELKELQDKNHAGSRSRPEELARAERRIVDAGWSEELARHVVIGCSDATSFTREALRTARAAFLQIGLQEQELRTLALQHSRALIAPVDIIQVWDIIRRQGPEPLARAGILCRSQPGSTKQLNGAPRPDEVAGTLDSVPESKTDERDLKRDWKSDLSKLFRLAAPTTSPDIHESTLAALSWIWDGSTQAAGVLDELARWMHIPKASSAREGLTASIRLIVRLCVDPTLQPFLRVSPECARFRLQIIRRFILKTEAQDFADAPQLLTLPWEKLPSEEWRYRVNAVKDHNLPVVNRQVLTLLFTPSRQIFSQELTRFKRPTR